MRTHPILNPINSPAHQVHADGLQEALAHKEKLPRFPAKPAMPRTRDAFTGELTSFGKLQDAAYLLSLLYKHGVCFDCGEMYQHAYDSPFATCDCRTSEWYTLTPYQVLELDIRSLQLQVAELARDLAIATGAPL